MWLQIVLSVLLAVVAIRFLMYISSHERVRALQENEDFSVRYPRSYLWISIVLYALASSVVLSLVIWQSTDFAGIAAAVVLGGAATLYFLRAQIWRIDVRSKYLIFVSLFGVKRLVHFDDIVSCTVYKRAIVVESLLKSFRISRQCIYTENFLDVLSLNHVPVHRDAD